MAAVYADHPFPLIHTPTYLEKQKSSSFEPNMFYRIASEMVLVHNMVIRGMNSIYLQAKQIKPSEELAFCNYTQQWLVLLHEHHHGEETSLFPYVEEASGIKGLMEKNIAQHHTFESGSQLFDKYINDVLQKKEKYDGQKVVDLLDTFAKALSEHLTDEIATLLKLQDVGEEKLKDMETLFKEEGDKIMKAIPMATALTWCFGQLDREYEDSMWASWPPAPAPVTFLCNSVLYWLHSDWWKFAPADRSGKLRPLHAAAAA